jgi:hypothetical protein
MKYYFKKIMLFPLAFGLTFCSSQKSTIKNNPVVIEKPCPDDGICTVEILRNKRMEIKKDDFGSIYYQTVDSHETSVVIYQYNRKVEKGLQDGNYREEIVFEIKKTDKKLLLQDLKLQQTKMLYGRFCFCKGETGYYEVTKGTLKLNQVNNNINFDLDFIVTEVPQIITTIHTAVK